MGFLASLGMTVHFYYMGGRSGDSIDNLLIEIHFCRIAASPSTVTLTYLSFRAERGISQTQRDLSKE
jgi:hypothetical protein